MRFLSTNGIARFSRRVRARSEHVTQKNSPRPAEHAHRHGAGRKRGNGAGRNLDQMPSEPPTVAGPLRKLRDGQPLARRGGSGRVNRDRARRKSK